MPSAAKSLALSKPTLAAILEGKTVSQAGGVLPSTARKIPAARRRCAQQKEERAAELEHLRALVANRGLRATARTLDVDPANLRRSLAMLGVQKSQYPSIWHHETVYITATTKLR